MPHVPDTDSLDEHRYLLLWREYLFGPVSDKAKEVLLRDYPDRVEP